MSKTVVGYTAKVLLKSGGVITNLVSLSDVNRVVLHHQNTGGYSVMDIDTKETVSVHKDAIEFINFKPIYASEEASDSSVGESQGETFAAANSNQAVGTTSQSD